MSLHPFLAISERTCFHERRQALFISFSTQAIQKCNSPEGCLCGVPQHKVNILGCKLFDEKDGSFIVEVDIGIDEDRH